MQFKSIIAVLALAFAVIATPVEPVAVKLVERTTPPAPPSPPPPTKTCKANQVLLSNCKANGAPVNISDTSALLGLLSLLIGIVAPITCLVGPVSVLNPNTVNCCDSKQLGSTNTQTGNLVALNVQDVINANCSPLIV